MKMKQNIISGKTLTKNQRLFNELFIIQNERFIMPLMSMRKIYKIEDTKRIVSAMLAVDNNQSKDNWSNLCEIINVCRNARFEFLEELKENEQIEFYDHIEKILKDNKLGPEWKNSLAEVVITGIFIPPLNNFDIQVDQKLKTLKLELNATTSLEDIKAAWYSINNAKTDIFGKKSRRNITNKSVDNLIATAKAMQAKEDYPDLKGTGILGEIYPDMDEKELDGEADKRATDNLRQIKSRLKRKV